MSPDHVLITGATSGIGRGLALAYAAPGRTLSLLGRDGTRLAQVIAACRQAGAAADGAALDVRDGAALGAWLRSADAARPIDLAIANAGIGGAGGAGAAEIFAVNLVGLANTIEPLMPRLAARRRGRIVLVSSLAAFRPYPIGPAYAASKAAVRAYGRGLRPLLAEHGVGLSLIYPGYVATPMTAANRFPMPQLLEVEDAARRIVAGLAAGHARIAFPYPLAALAQALALLPDPLASWLMRRYPRKELVLDQPPR
jgi:short-subunit dehydrogenase